jgi:hypothetical protein
MNGNYAYFGEDDILSGDYEHGQGHTFTVAYNNMATPEWEIATGSTVLATKSGSDPFGTYTNESGVTGTIIGSSIPVYWGIRQGDVAQVVVTGSGTGDKILSSYERYSMQIDVYDDNYRAAEQRALAINRWFAQYVGTQTGAPGWTGSVWCALQVQTSYDGIIEAVQVTGKQLYRGVIDLLLVQVQQV